MKLDPQDHTKQDTVHLRSTVDSSESQTTTWDAFFHKTVINYQPQLVSRISSINSWSLKQDLVNNAMFAISTGGRDSPGRLGHGLTDGFQGWTRSTKRYPGTLHIAHMYMLYMVIWSKKWYEPRGKNDCWCVFPWFWLLFPQFLIFFLEREVYLGVTIQCWMLPFWRGRKYVILT